MLTFMSVTNSTWLIRLYPSVAQKAYSGFLPLRNSTQSICICWPGAVSKRTTGSIGAAGQKRAHEGAQLARSARVALRHNLAHQHRRGIQFAGAPPADARANILRTVPTYLPASPCAHSAASQGPPSGLVPY